MTGWFSLNVQVTVALIGGLIVAVGWFVNAWRDRVDQRRARLERVRDGLTAHRAEVFRTMGPERREAMYTDYVSLQLQAFALRKTAVAVIHTELGRAYA